MGYDTAALRRASSRLSDQRAQRQIDLESRRRELFQRCPELSDIDRQLRGTMLDVISSCLKAGSDPGPKLRVIRDGNMELQNRQARLLEGMGYPPDALRDVPVCKLCGDSGWIKGEMCQCLRTLYTDEAVKALGQDLDVANQTFDAFSLDWYSDLPFPGRELSPRENMESIRELCRMYAVRFGRFPVKNLFLTGEPGLGKTFLSACIARTVAEEGNWVIYVTAGELFFAFQEQNFAHNVEEGKDSQDKTRGYLTCDLLILDDLGSEWTVPSTQAALYTLINTRLQQGKATVISSNLDLGGLTERYTGQIASRVRGEYQVLEFYGEDIRPKRKNRV